MENTQEYNLKNALVQLRVSIQDLDLLRNDIVKHDKESDDIKEILQNSILPIPESLKI